MNKREVWEIIRHVMQGFATHYGDVIVDAASSFGLEPSGFFLVILPAYLFEPDPISAARLRKRIPYNSPNYYQEPLMAVKNAGFLEKAPEGGYFLNERGHQALKKVMGAAYQKMDQLAPLSLRALDDLKLLLAKLIQSAILSPDIPSKWSILHSRRLDPGRNVSSIITIDQYLSDISSYRDDAHLASWSSYAISAHAWNILGALWQDQVSSGADVRELLKNRRWTEFETQEAINELVQKGWVSSGEKLTITDKGQQVRDHAEELTNKYFFSPWSVLTDVEYGLLCQLLTQLNENLVDKPYPASTA